MKKFIPIAQPVLNGNEKKYVLNCLNTSWISSNGKYINKFEKKFAKFIGTKHGISCFNGTVALHLALLAFDVKNNDEVIVPTFTYIATANAVKYCGAKPVFADIETETWNIDPEDIERKITKKTKGIIIVHLYGHPANMDPILKIARKYNLFVIEDAAEAHGALYKNKKVGSIGDIGTFSFFGNKIITTGEGGMITTNNDRLAEKIRLLKGQGMDPKRRYWFIKIGYNYRMTNIQAAIGLGQLEKIKWHINQRQRVAKLYLKNLKHLEKYLILPKTQKWAFNSFWMFSIVLKENVKINRDEFMKKLNDEGIETRPFFYPLHKMPPYFDKSIKLPNAEKIALRGLNLPSHALLNEKDIKYICQKIEKILITTKK